MLFGNLFHPKAAGTLEHAGPDYANVVIFHSLSKRSSLPGLRVGFAAGDRDFLSSLPRIAQCVGAAGAGARAGSGDRAYADEAHVQENRGFIPRNSISPTRSSAAATVTSAGRRLLPLARHLRLWRQRRGGAQALA
jgi:aspartate/methionine/tyrosine aminotransferase